MTKKGKSGKMPTESTVVELENKYKQYMEDGEMCYPGPPWEELVPDALLIEYSQREEWDWEDRDFVDFDGTWVYYIVARKRVGIKIPVKLRFDNNINWEFLHDGYPEDDDEKELPRCLNCGARKVRKISSNEFECEWCDRKQQ
jgi:hypothetical protein